MRDDLILIDNSSGVFQRCNHVFSDQVRVAGQDLFHGVPARNHARQRRRQASNRDRRASRSGWCRDGCKAIQRVGDSSFIWIPSGLPTIGSRRPASVAYERSMPRISSCCVIQRSRLRGF